MGSRPGVGLGFTAGCFLCIFLLRSGQTHGTGFGPLSQVALQHTRPSPPGLAPVVPLQNIGRGRQEGGCKASSLLAAELVSCALCARDSPVRLVTHTDEFPGAGAMGNSRDPGRR